MDRCDECNVVSKSSESQESDGRLCHNNWAKARSHETMAMRSDRATGRIRVLRPRPQFGGLSPKSQSAGSCVFPIVDGRAMGTGLC